MRVLTNHFRRIAEPEIGDLPVHESQEDVRPRNAQDHNGHHVQGEVSETDALVKEESDHEKEENGTKE